MIISPLSRIFKLRFWIYELFKGWFQWNTNKDKIYSIIYTQNLKNKPIDINIFWKMMELNIMQIQIKLIYHNKIWTFAHLTWPGFLFTVVAVCSTVLAFFFSFFFSLSAKVPRILDIISESVLAYWIRCFNYLKTSYFSLCWRLFTLVINISNFITQIWANFKHILKEICQVWWVPKENKLWPLIRNWDKVRFNYVYQKNHRFSYGRNRTLKNLHHWSSPLKDREECTGKLSMPYRDTRQVKMCMDFVTS